MNEHRVKRNPDGWVIENCPTNIGVKIGSFDCTANCPHNENTKKEIQEQGFDLEFVRCSKIQKEQQLKIQI
jgi:hypothetical protein